MEVREEQAVGRKAVTRRRRENPKRPVKHPGIPDFRGKKIVIASDINIRRLYEYVPAVLEAIGYPTALVTDASKIHDFPVKCECHPDRDDSDSEDVSVAEVAQRLNVPVMPTDYIWEVAERVALRR